MSSRIQALDGLRGFAALSVLLSHSGFEAHSVFGPQIGTFFYRLFQVGPNAVQILFVLCGFFMAYLYPKVPSISQFVQKRYTRIIPVFAVVCIFLSLLRILQYYVSLYWYHQLFLLITVTIIFSFLWQSMRRFDYKRTLGKTIFVAFIGLQFCLVIFNTFILPKFTQGTLITFTGLAQTIYLFLTNVTLTTTFGKYIEPLLSVFWSLAPEVLFYLLYPIIAIPLIALARKTNIWVAIFIIIGVTKILFDLDKAAFSYAAFNGLHLGRATGFMVGTVIGTLYLSKDRIWNTLQSFISRKEVCVIVLLLFCATQWADDTIRHGASDQVENWYFLISSWVIGAVMVSAISQGTIVYRIFSNKILVFLGLISYSLYLIHLKIVTYSSDIMHYFATVITHKGFSELLSLTITLTLSIAVAAFLYRLVEYLYFSGKQSISEVKTNEKPAYEIPAFSLNKAFIFGNLIVLFCLLTIYSGSYSPTLFVSRHPVTQHLFTVNNEQSLLNSKITVPFTAETSNLAILALNMRYEGDAYMTSHYSQNPAQLTFRLLDKERNVLFESQRSAFNIEGQRQFPFGFPIVEASRNQTYFVELEQSGGDDNDQIFIDTSAASLVSGYTLSKSELIRKPYIFFVNRLLFVLKNPDALFAIGFTIICSAGLLMKKNPYNYACYLGKLGKFSKRLEFVKP